MTVGVVRFVTALSRLQAWTKFSEAVAETVLSATEGNDMTQSMRWTHLSTLLKKLYTKHKPQHR